MRATYSGLFASVILLALAPQASADVITDWNAIAAPLVQSSMLPPPGHRAMAIIHVAMFDAVNSIDRRYRPYQVQLPAAPATSKEAAAATAAATALISLVPQAADKAKEALAAYLAAIPSGDAKSDGVKLGEAVATMILEARVKDGANGPDEYRPKTRPGVYIPTAMVAVPMWGSVKPFTMTSPSQFRPAPPLSLSSEQWAADLNEIKANGGRASTTRSASQTEDARFWLVTGPQAYDPIVRQIVAAKKMSVIDSARFMALTSVAMADALIAVLEAKYHYEFWRPITAVRNGEMHGNAAVERDATWQPIDNTPMHPEYPCAHCILGASLASVVETVFGSVDVPEVVMTSPTAPGITHRWTNMRALADEISEARIWAGFHYRFSTRVGQDMGFKIGRQAAETVMLPAAGTPSATR